MEKTNTLAEIILDLNKINESVFKLKEFAKQVIHFSKQDGISIEDIKTIIKTYDAEKILEQLNPK